MSVALIRSVEYRFTNIGAAAAKDQAEHNTNGDPLGKETGDYTTSSLQ